MSDMFIMPLITGGYWAADKSFSWIKTRLESVLPDNKKIVFVKDFAHGLEGHYEYIPDDCRHSILIRHPYQVFAS